MGGRPEGGKDRGGAALAIVGGNSFRDVVAAACPSSSSSVVVAKRREGGRRKDGAHELCWRFRLFGVLQSSSRLLFLLHRGTLSVPICMHPLPVSDALQMHCWRRQQQRYRTTSVEMQTSTAGAVSREKKTYTKRSQRRKPLKRHVGFL